MFAIPVISVDPDGSILYQDGLLYPLMPDLGGKNKIESYARINGAGWREIDFGFLAYIVVEDTGRRLIFPGLNPLGSKQSGRFSGATQVFSREDIEAYVAQVRAFQASSRDAVLEEFNLLVHDLRRLSTSIYHAAEEAKAELQSGNTFNVVERLDNIIGAQSMLKIRTDVLDFSGNPSADLSSKHVPVYRRFDKVVRSFKPFAAKRNIQLSINGPSHSTSKGPDVFEIVPYVVLDNAIKYSPSNTSIDVVAREDDREICFFVKSFGPKIKSSEINEIFSKGYRGEYARTAGFSGSGVGLFLASQLIKRFNGSISVIAGGEEFLIKSVSFFQNTFKISLPISEKRVG